MESSEVTKSQHPAKVNKQFTKPQKLFVRVKDTWQQL